MTVATARRDLKVLRAAVNLYHGEFTLTAVPKVTLPDKAVGRERWLTRLKAGRLLAASLGFIWDAKAGRWARDEAGRLMRRDRITRARRVHIRCFLLVGLYTGTRHEAVERLQWLPNTTGGWIDLERGRIYRRGQGERETKTRRPPAKLAHRLAPHLVRWKQLDQRRADELTAWAGETVAILHVVHTRAGAALVRPIRTGWEGAWPTRASTGPWCRTSCATRPRPE